MQVPWFWWFRKTVNYYDCTLTSTEAILSRTSSKNDQHSLKITKPNGKCSMFCTIPLENDGDILNEIYFEIKFKFINLKRN